MDNRKKKKKRKVPIKEDKEKPLTLNEIFKIPINEKDIKTPEQKLEQQNNEPRIPKTAIFNFSSLNPYSKTSNSDLLFDLSQILSFASVNDTYSIKLLLLNCQIPYSFYNIDTHNNVVDVIESDEDGSNPQSPYQVFLQKGNYNINELITELSSLLNANSNYGINYLITYDQIRNKVTLSTTTVNKRATFDFTLIDSAGSIFGFSDNTFFMTTNIDLTSDNVVKVFQDASIYIRTDVVTNIFDSNQDLSIKTLEKIPIMNNPNTIIFYENIVHEDKFVLFNGKPGANTLLSLKLTYEDGRFINLNGLDWGGTLLIKFE